MKKYKELYDYCKNIFSEEQNRFNRIDLKASQYIAVLTLLIGASGYFGKWLIEKIIPPNCFLDWALFILGILIFITIIIAWYFNFRVLKQHLILKPPLNDEIINFYNENRLIDIYFSMSDRFRESLEYNQKITNEKAKYLSFGYKSIVMTMSFLFIFTILFTVKSWNNNLYKPIKKGIVMPEDNNQSQEPSNSNEKKPVTIEKPNPNIIAPTFQLVTEGYDPKQLIKRIISDKKIVKGIVPKSTRKDK